MILILRLILLSILAFVLYKRGVLDLRGTLAATAVGGTIIFLAGFSWFFLLLIFLSIGYAATKYRYSYKEGLHIAERNTGTRSATNVLANGLIPTFFAVFWYINKVEALEAPSTLIIAGYIAAIATVTGDTLSAEIGVLSKRRPVLITTFEKVPHGAHGGVSLLGEFIGFLGTALIGVFAWVLGMAPLASSLSFAVIGGALGFHFDSLLGATVERRGLCGNATVNFLSSIAGSLTGIGIAMAL